MDSSVIAILGSIVTALLTWIGWLIKKSVDDKTSHQQSQEELKILISQFTDSLDTLLSISTEMVRGLKIALQSDVLQFQNAHDSGLMNGESVEHIQKINEYMRDISEVEETLKKVKVDSRKN